MTDIQNNEMINAVPLFLCEVRFAAEGEAAIDINVSDALEAYEEAGEMFEEIIGSITEVLVGDCIFLCGGLGLIFDEERLEGTSFSVEHLMLEDNTCHAEFDENYYDMLTEDITEVQQIKLDFLMELFAQSCQATHEMITDLLGDLTESIDKSRRSQKLQ